MTRAALLLLLLLAGCAPKPQFVVVWARMDIICVPTEQGYVNCADVDTWNEYAEQRKKQRMAF